MISLFYLRGKIISPVLLLIFLENIDGVSQYKPVQEKRDIFNVQIVKGQNFEQATMEKIRKQLREVLPRNSQINIGIVSEIPRNKSGKVRPMESKVPVNL